MKIRPVEPGDTEEVADVFLAALAGMTYLPELYTDAETRIFIRDGDGFTLAELTDGRDNEEREPDAHYEWRPGRRSANPP